MKYRLLDILACPICKNWPLKFLSFAEVRYEYKDLKIKTPFCKEYCALKLDYVKNINIAELDCTECTKREITDGILICEKCNRWYPIIEEIPVMLPDELRKEKDDKLFLEKWKDKIPIEIIKKGLPYHL